MNCIPWEEIAKKIINELWNMNGAHYFHIAIEHIKSNISDNTLIVEKSIDFGIIKTKLKDSQYNNCQEFILDVQMVFKNCLVQDGCESHFGKIAQQLQLYFEQEIEKNGLKKQL